MNQRIRAPFSLRPPRTILCLAIVAVLLATLLAMATATATTVAAATAADCGCPSTGPYVDPAKGRNVDLTADGSSPHGTYGVLASTVGAPEGRPNLTVKRASDNATVLSGIQGSQWGFSPDDDRFVVHYLHQGMHQIALYDLTRSGSAALLWTHQGAVTSDRIQFSPTGAYFFYSAVVNGSVRLQVVDTATGDTAYQTEFLARSAPGYGGDSFGSASWGFSPHDTGFVFGHLTSQTAARMHVVDLATGDVTHTEEMFDIAAWWRFSPCGDAIGIVRQTSTEQLDIAVRDVATGDRIGGTTSAVVPVQFRATATHHVANVGGTDVQVGANTAGEPCPPPPNKAPTASFAPPGTVFVDSPITLEDTSTDEDGQIATWRWNFGDNRVSSAQHPTKTWTNTGTYTVTLTVTDDDGATATATRSVSVVANQPPVADFDWTPDPPAARQTVTLRDESTSDDGIASRRWTVGARTLSGATATFTACQTVDVELTVTDLAGQSDTETRTIQVIGELDPRDVTVPAGGSLVDAGRDACPGDAITLPAGTFSAGDGVVLDGVDLTGAGEGETTVEGTASARYALLAGSDEVRIADLTVTGAGGAGTPGAGIVAATSGRTTVDSVEVTGSTGRAGIACPSGMSTSQRRYGELLVVDSEIHHNSSADVGGGVGGQCNGDVTVRDSQIHHNTGLRGAGVAHFSSLEQEPRLEVTGSEIHDNTGETAVGIGAETDNSRVLRNVVRDNVGTSPFRPSAGVMVNEGALVAGNLVTDNEGEGVTLLGYDAKGVVVASNTITGNEGVGLYGAHSETWTNPVTLFNNIITENAGREVDAAVCTSGHNLLGFQSIPLFAPHPDKHLRPGSPAIDAGSNAAVPEALLADGDGESRVVDGNSSGVATVDIGWDEAGAGSAAGTADAPPAPLLDEPCDPAHHEVVEGVLDLAGDSRVSTLGEADGPTAADPVETSVRGAPGSSGTPLVRIEEWLDIDPERAGGVSLPAERWTVKVDMPGATEWDTQVIRIALDASLVPEWATERNFRAAGWGSPGSCPSVGSCTVSREINDEGDLVYTLQSHMPFAEFSVDVLPTPDRPTWVSTPDAVTSADEATFDWSVGEGRIGHYECSLDGAPMQECDDPLHLEGLAEGTHELAVVTSTFADPDITSDPVTYEWTVDRTAPAAPAATQSGRTASTVTVGWPAVTDAHGLAGYRVRADGGDPVTVTETTYTVGGLACGQSRTVRVEALDRAGNVSPAGSVVATTAACAGPAPGPTPPTAQCVVPKLKGKTLAQARKALAAADCRLGKVTKAAAKRSKVKKVLRHSPVAGTRLPVGATVSVVIGRR